MAPGIVLGIVTVASLGIGLGLMPAAAEDPGRLVSGSSAETGAVDTEAVDRFIEEQMGKHGLPGVSLAVFDNKHVVYSQGYGSAGGDRSMADTTPMHVGSITKPFTAVAVLQLAEQDLVDLDAPVPTNWKGCEGGQNGFVEPDSRDYEGSTRVNDAECPWAARGSHTTAGRGSRRPRVRNWP